MPCAPVFPLHTPKWANYIYCIYALSIRCYRLWNQLCQQSYRKHFSNIQLPIFLLRYLSLLHSFSSSLSISFSSSSSPLKFCRVSLVSSPQTTLNMSCTIATCIEPENWVKILFHFPSLSLFPSSLTHSHSRVNNFLSIHKLFSWLEKAFLVAFFN